MITAFAFDRKTCNLENQLYCEPYGAGVYHINRLYECFKGDLTEKELETERKNFHLFDRENNNLVLGMISYIINNYKVNPQIILNKHGKKISSYKYQVVGHNASGFDNYIVLNSLPKPYTTVRMIKTSRWLKKIRFGVGPVYEDDREIL